MIIEKLPQKFDENDVKIIKKNLGENIKKARLKVGLSQKELANMLHLKSATYISLIEGGHRGLSATTLYKIARITQESVKNFYLQGLI
jgi:transcriptional regulator with XRE-family HTH domain